MQAPHLSRLCRDGDIEAIVSYLRTKVDVPIRTARAVATPSLQTSASPHQTNTTVVRNNEICTSNNDNGDERGEKEHSSTAVEKSVHTSEERPEYMSGIWGYRDADGRTVFHWAVAVENYTLAKALMSPPHNAPVLSEDDTHTTPFMTACTLAAPVDFLETLLNKSAEVYTEYMQWKSKHEEQIPAHVQRHNLSLEQQRQVQETEQAVTNTNAKASNFNKHNINDNTVLDKVQEKETQSSVQQEGTNNRAGMRGISENAKCKSSTLHANTQSIRHAIVNWEDDLGNTSLFLAVRKGQKEVVHFLLQHGAELMHQNKRGQSVLHRAVMSAKLHLIEELVHYSEKLHATNKKCHRDWMNLQDKRGDSALFYASSDENEDIGVFLLRHGADRHLRNKEGKEFWEV